MRRPLPAGCAATRGIVSPLWLPPVLRFRRCRLFPGPSSICFPSLLLSCSSTSRPLPVRFRSASSPLIMRYAPLSRMRDKTAIFGLP